jgi:hypothetical protein
MISITLEVTSILKIKLVLTVEIVTLETMKRDTLSNGKIIVRSFPGQIAQVPVDEQETYLRQNSVRVTMLIIVMVINNPLNIIILENQSQMMLRKKLIKCTTRLSIMLRQIV